VVEVAADAYAEEDGYATFSVLAEATPEEQRQIRVLGLSLVGTTVDFLVARIAMSEVANVEGGWPWEPTSGD